MVRAAFWRDVLYCDREGLNSVRAYGRLLRQGRRLERPTGDTLQLGGDFVVDREGRLAYVYRSRGPDDRPSVDDLLDAVRSYR